VAGKPWSGHGWFDVSNIGGYTMGFLEDAYRFYPIYFGPRASPR